MSIEINGVELELTQYIGLTFDQGTVTDVESYYDFSTDQEEQAFILNGEYGVNCELFIRQMN